MKIGLIGLGTMGANLARNAARNGATVSVFNRTAEKTDAFMRSHGSEGKFVPHHDLQEFVRSMEGPRAIVLMVKAGKPVDDVIEELLPFVDKGDILIDAGNSHFNDTARRTAFLREKGLHFVGMGVSGGEEGALWGPSMMPGGDKAAVDHLMPLLLKMAAPDGTGGSCVSYMGPDGAGHFVKMVHNGIEYGIMQLIAETYDVLRTLGRLDNKDLGALFFEWNKGDDLQSFLIEITSRVFKQVDMDTGGDLIDVIKDAAGQKGTGKWTTDTAMNVGAAVPTITAAVDARILSGDPKLRAEGKAYPAEVSIAPLDPRDVAAMCRSALELSTICCYLQGFSLIEKVSAEQQWNIDRAEVARIWRGGCIIRSVLLPTFQRTYGRGGTMEEVLHRFSGKRQENWRLLVGAAVMAGIPVPAFGSALAYFDTLRREKLPQNLIQGQRDLFGAHTYERTDKSGIFHTEWD